ncbi:MAG: lipase [bacterium]|nr:lipase [bacterium]
MTKQFTIFVCAFLLSSGAVFAGGGGSSSGPLVNSHPIVLGHGILGFDDSNGPAAGLLQYWGDVDQYLRDEGVAVLTPGKTAAAGLGLRAKQQADQISYWMAANGFSKVNYFGHSQGGLDGRYMITNNTCGASGYCMRNVVRSITTINTPHRGSPVGDIALGVIPNWLEPFLGTVLDALAGLLFSDNQQDVLAMADTLTVAGTSIFNANTPNVSGVKYFSYGSYITIPDLIQHPIMGLLTPATWAGGLIYGQGGKNDGIVPYSSQKWGTWKGGPKQRWNTAGVDHLQATNFQWGGQFWYDVEGYYLKMAKNAMNNQ